MMLTPGPTRVIHANERLVVVAKPAGLLSVPGRTEPDCASSRIQSLYPDARIVHRLDQATSGLLLFARGPQAQRELSTEFAERRVGKVYIAIVEGHLTGEGLVDQPLGADWPNRPRQQIDPHHGKPSQTHWRVLAHEGPNTRLTLSPLTGRTHQLRVHMAHLGHAILGDMLYASPATAEASPRLLLHASELHIDGHHFLCPAEF